MHCAVCGHDADPRAPAFLLECHFCGRWLHGACVQLSEQDALLVAKFACPDCRQQHGHSTVKYEPSSVNNGPFDAGNLSFSPLPVHLGGYAASTPAQLRHKKSSSSFRRLLGAAVYARTGLHSVPSQDVQPSFLQHHALEEPVLIAGNNHCVAGLDAPFPVLDAASVANLLSKNQVVRATDVATQSKQQLTTSAWQAQTTSTDQQNEENPATRLVNAEFPLRQTSMQLQVAAPVAVTQVDWSCLASNENDGSSSTNSNAFGAFLEANAYLDFTLAPGGQCTWLSVSAGELWVYLIPPTSTNLDAYRDWKNDPDFASAFLPERTDKCIKCVVGAGSTMLVPAGWMYARFAGGTQSCSVLYGYFACTAGMDAQLAVVMLETQHDALAQYWSETTSGWVDADANVQLWMAVCHYVRQLLTSNSEMNTRVSDQDRRALNRALPRLREWSALPASLKSVNDIAWTPSSQQEAQSIVNRLEHALASTCLPTHGLDGLQLTSGLSSDNKLPPISPNEATYIYSAASAPDSVSGSPWVASSSGFDTHNTTSFTTSTPMGSMWSNYDPIQQQQQGHLVISTQNQPYLNNPSLQQQSPTQHLQGYGGADYGYLSPPGTALGGHGGYMAAQTSLGLEGLAGVSALGVPGAEFQHPQVDSNGNYVDVLMRHRASCHRCGNLRKKNIRCLVCPHIFCAKCADKMIEEHGDRIFENGCPVCKELCCCGKNRTTRCTRKFHCYKKCPSTKRPAAG
ncbi:hypothetical protein PR003_g17874 [Phytophthora rubi]|uniref:JmjC domain-containing protein n=1 Tax=Phytophthora rubi TaxID=129364 RepID=A0A6A4ELK7_9STRA|nr:hypothetical protein PR001_g20242 [Phytophthora rubi]KAE9002991.1 hypothetical protein PR002_g17476 [Phytophthora rubi]KAE9319862.1 hypothetical protein PR003_g17874 [Phytophthora rubi]